MRLDVYLVEKAYYISRHQAQNEIKNGCVMVNDTIVYKASFDVKDKDTIHIVGVYNPYASVAGLKLEKALDTFTIDVNKQSIIDVGASTGGFTDCLIKKGASKIYAVDVGSNQLLPRLVNDPRVINYENTNFLTTRREDFGLIDLVVIDVSFTSAIPLIAHAYSLTPTPIVWLLKPQFESMKPLKTGIIRKKAIHVQIIDNVIKRLKDISIHIQDFTYSPIKGSKGNIEFLCLLSKHQGLLNIHETIDEAHRVLP